MNEPTAKSMMQIFVDDYQIPQSRLITHKCIVAAVTLITIILFIEIAVDLKATSIELILPTLIFNLILLFYSIRNKEAKNLGVIQVFIFWTIIVAHLAINTSFFHVMVYWMPFIPMQALITKGMRAAKLWLIITILTIVAGGFYGNYTMGSSYQFTSGFLEFGSAGLIFLLSIFSAFYLFYSLLGDAYGQLKGKNSEIERLNTVLSQINDTLEDRVMKRTKDIEDQKLKLEKIAFMNSHMVRSSLSTIVGAIEVLNIDKSKQEEMIKVIVKSSKEMDEAVRDMGDALS